MKKISLTKQIEVLRLDLARAEERASNYGKRAIDAEEKIKEGERSRFMRLEDNFRREHDKSELLTEIVRWLINPEATKDPFGVLAARENERKMRGL